jgi:hypothetical protein
VAFYFTFLADGDPIKRILRPASGLNIKPLNNKHISYAIHIRFINESFACESPLLLGLLLRQDVIFVSMLKLNLTSASDFESLLGA